MQPRILTFDGPQAAAEACGRRIFEIAAAAREARGLATLAVSGGSTPRIMFEYMARQPFDWTRVHLFWVDERCVPPDHEQSNYRMTRLALLDHAPVAADQIHRIQAELPPADAARIYEEEIRSTLGTPVGELPVFDMVQQGMGPDAHTASLFPGEPLIQDRQRTVAAVWVEKFRQHRVTLLPGVLERARHKLLLVTGVEKAEPLYEVMRGERDPLKYPSQIIPPDAVWYADEAAAGRLAQRAGGS